MDKTRTAVFVLLALAVLTVGGVAWASNSANYAFPWQVLSGGGAPATGGNVALNGSLGQTAVGPSTSASYSLGAGYWYGIGAAPPVGSVKMYLPLVFRE